MKFISQSSPLLSSLLVASALSACAAGSHPVTDRSHARMHMADMEAMCEMHKKMMSGASSGEHRAMMQQHMNSMPPEKRQRMEAMMEKCG